MSTAGSEFREQLEKAMEQGHGDEDISTLFRLKDLLFATAAGDPTRES